MSEASVKFARALGFTAWLGWDAVPDTPFDAVIDAATDASTAARAVERVQPGGRLAFIGIAYAGWNTDWSWLFLGVILFIAVLVNTFIGRRAQGAKK